MGVIASYPATGTVDNFDCKVNELFVFPQQIITAASFLAVPAIHW